MQIVYKYILIDLKILFYLHITQMQVIRLTLAAREIDSPTIQLIDDDVYCLRIWISAKTYVERHHEQTVVI